MKTFTKNVIGTVVVLIIAYLLFWWFVPSAPVAEVYSEEICDLLDNDGDGRVDEGFTVTCNENIDCGPSAGYGKPFCREGHLYQYDFKHHCVNQPGTCLSECVGKQGEQRIETCLNGCRQGKCIS